MDNFFDKSLHYLGRKQKETLAINIGAMDGVLFDEMIGYTNMYGYKVLYVEPIPYLFERLKNNVSNGASFENSAISDYDGEIEMIMIDQKVIDDGLVHNCFYGMSAVYPPKNGLGSEFDRPTVEKYGKMINVPCITFENLISKHNFKNFDIIKIDTEGHDFVIFKQIDFEKYSPKVIRMEWINLSDKEQNETKEIFEKNDFIYEISGQDIVGIPKYLFNEIKNNYSTSDEKSDLKIENVYSSKITLVTGLWDIKRSELSEGWRRDYEHYLSKLDDLLKIETNFIIFGDSDLEIFINSKGKKNNVQFIKRDSSWFKNNDYYQLIQKIRTNPDWFNQVGWLPESTQAKLEMYNPLVMSKMFLLHDAMILDKFDSEYMFWIDAGITNTVHPGYFTHDKVLDKLPKYVKNFHFISFPYETTSEIHGFKYDEIKKYCNSDKVNKVSRAGFFGGKKESLGEINTIYYSLMMDTLNNGLMGTEESLFTIMTYRNPELITYSLIDDNGLIWKFFEDLKNDDVKVLSEEIKVIKNEIQNENESLYLIKVKDSQQFENLVKTLSENNPDLLKSTETYLINNSVENQNDEEYKKVCNVNRIKYSTSKDNEAITNFFEELKKLKSPNTSKVGLYVITFNSPAQFEILIKSMLEYDPDFINKPQKFLLDNSTDLSTTPRYLELCERYGFEHIKKDNIGIMGGRVFVAEHFNETDLNYYWFWEDDMALYPKKDEVCANGFNRYVDSLYQKSMEIIEKENFDFLKISFTEFYGSNDVQFSWYNVPQEFRQKHWPEKSKLPVQGLDPNSPRTKFDEIHIYKGLPYITGQIYLSNWPILLNKEGNYKCYLETKWARPFEQTSMSYVFQETIKGRIKPGILLLTPIEHNRFHHYEGNLRKES